MNNETNKANVLTELARRNAEVFKIAVRDQNQKILDQQIQINGLVNTISLLQNRMNEQEQRMNILQVKLMGRGATV